MSKLIIFSLNNYNKTFFLIADLTAKVNSLPSLFYFKKSLALSSNIETIPSDILLAQELAAQAIQVKQMESLFKEENKKLNALVGLGEAEAMYREGGKRAEERRKEEEEKKRNIYLGKIIFIVFILFDRG